MDLLSSIRKEGSRGGVSFSWSDVTTSQHRENYLGHSIMAPVGRWQKGKDLTWYTKSDSTSDKTDETIEEKRTRERNEEIRRIKDAEEDALARALGLPVKDRNSRECNSITLREVKSVVKETEVGEDNEVDIGRKLAHFSGQNREVHKHLRSTKEQDIKISRKTKTRMRKSRSPRRDRNSRRYRRIPKDRNELRLEENQSRHGRGEVDERKYSCDPSRSRYRSISYDNDRSKIDSERRKFYSRSRSPDSRSNRPWRTHRTLRDR